MPMRGRVIDRLSVLTVWLMAMVCIASPLRAEPSFQEAFGKHSAVMLLIDPETGEVVDANRAAAEFYGYSQGRLRQMKIQDINQFTPEQVAAERKLAETEGRNFFIFRHKLADGDIRTVEVHSVPLKFGARVLLFSIIRDISAQRSLEQDLWHYQTRLEQMVDLQTQEIRAKSRTTIMVLSAGAVGLAVMVVLLIAALRRHLRDEQKLLENREHYRRMVNGLRQHFLYSHGPDGIFSYVSPSITPILGYMPEEFMTDFDAFLTDAAINNEVIAHTQMSIRGVQQPPYCIEIFHKDGTPRTLEVLERPVFDDNGNVTAVEGIAQDITERLQLETNTRAALNAAKYANQAKSEFLANMSHELRTPLNSIIGFAELMSYELKGPLPPAYHEYAELITNSGRLLLETVNSILDLAKIEAGKFDLQCEPMHMNGIVHEVLSLLYIQAKEKGIDLRDETQDLQCLDIDPVRVKQVLMNIIGNAIKFTESGTVTIANACREDGHVLTITDTGIGMSREQIEIALEPFQQVHGSSLARRFQGTGLGLSLSRQIMKLHGGELEITSALKSGTQVSLLFPMSCEHDELPDPAVSA